MLRIVFVFVFAFYIMYVINFLIASVRNNLTAAVEQIFGCLFDYWFKSFNTPCANNDINNNNNNNNNDNNTR